MKRALKNPIASAVLPQEAGGRRRAPGHKQPAAGCCLVILATACGPRGFTQQIPMRPFVINHEARSDSPADVAFLLDPPAGKYGFIQVRDGHLATPNGRRFRIWGVNLTGWTEGSTLLPPKSEAPLWAAALARLGVNCVRFHFLDRTTTEKPAGLIAGDRNDTRVLDPERLDRLDFFVAELKRRGIYVNLNLNVGRNYRPGDGVPDHDLIGVAKGMTYIGERLLELQREYARQLLTHYNPYTKSEYRHEPAVAIVEIVNENSIFEFWMRNWIRGRLASGLPRYQLDFTPYYEKILTERYNQWLGAKLSPPELRRLREAAGVEAGAPIPRLRREEFAEAPKERFYLEAMFYTEVETKFFAEMESYLKNTLGVRSLIVGTADHTYWIPFQPLLRSTSRMDIVDAHVYWQHPAIWGKRNTPMVNQPLASTIVKLSRSAFAGKPFTVSEVNHPNPNEYASEMIPILAAYAAFQDWDGIFFYTFEPKLAGRREPYLRDPFDISLDPVKTPQLAAGALMFLRPDVRPARQTVLRSYSSEQIHESMRLPEAERPYFTPGFPLVIPLRHGSRVRCLDCEAAPPVSATVTNPIVSDTGELAWHWSQQGEGLVTVDTDRTQALIGFVKAHAKPIRHLSADVRNEFCAITLSSLDSKPISRSARLLVTAGARVENTGQKWNDRRTLLLDWGGPPTLIEPVTGWLTLRELEGAVGLRVKALDSAARQLGDDLRGRRLEEGWEMPVGEPPTTFYLVEVIR